MNNIENENVFFSINEEQIDKEYDKEENVILYGLLDEINNDFDFVSNQEINQAMYNEYKINYTVKELLLICDYYGIAKEMKNNKYNKDEIINVLVHFENDPINNDIFMRRQSMWYYIDKLKNDKFMKKYVLW